MTPQLATNDGLTNVKLVIVGDGSPSPFQFIPCSERVVTHGLVAVEPMLLFPELHICPISAEDGLIFGSSYQSTVKQLVKAGQTGRNLTDQNPSGRSIQMLDLSPASLCVLKCYMANIVFQSFAYL